MDIWFGIIILALGVRGLKFIIGSNDNFFLSKTLFFFSFLFLLFFFLSSSLVLRTLIRHGGQNGQNTNFSDLCYTIIARGASIVTG